MQALLIIDMQMDMQHRIEAGLDHVNGDAPDRVVQLAGAFRQNGQPVLHVYHRDTHPDSPMAADAPGFPPMPCAEAADGEAVFIKHTSSAFASTGLEDHLRRNGITQLVVAGAVAGFCVNSTVRAGADLGFDMTVARDAVLGFGLPFADLSARTIFDVTMAHLQADFAQVVDTAEILRRG